MVWNPPIWLSWLTAVLSHPPASVFPALGFKMHTTTLGFSYMSFGLQNQVYVFLWQVYWLSHLLTHHGHFLYCIPTKQLLPWKLPAAREGPLSTTAPVMIHGFMCFQFFYVLLYSWCIYTTKDKGKNDGQRQDWKPKEGVVWEMSTWKGWRHSRWGSWDRSKASLRFLASTEQKGNPSSSYLTQGHTLCSQRRKRVSCVLGWFMTFFF